jgi:hypothetical protein
MLEVLLLSTRSCVDGDTICYLLMETNVIYVATKMNTSDTNSSNKQPKIGHGIHLQIGYDIDINALVKPGNYPYCAKVFYLYK